MSNAEVVKKSKDENEPDKAKSTNTFRVDNFLVELTTRFGLSGMAVIVAIYIFLRYGTEEQKRSFIDRFLLLKIPKDDGYLFYFIVICLAALYFLTLKYYKDRIKIKDDRIKELQETVDILSTKTKK